MAVPQAGYGAFGVVEESTADIINEQFNVNVIGPINLSKAFLPSLRAQGSNGWLLFMSSVGAWFSMPGGSVYQASKHALRGLSNGLAHELEPIGTHVLAVEVGRFLGQQQKRADAKGSATAWDGQDAFLWTGQPEAVRRNAAWRPV